MKIEINTLLTSKEAKILKDILFAFFNTEFNFFFEKNKTRFEVDIK